MLTSAKKWQNHIPFCSFCCFFSSWCTRKSRRISHFSILQIQLWQEACRANTARCPTLRAQLPNLPSTGSSLPCPSSSAKHSLPLEMSGFHRCCHSWCAWGAPGTPGETHAGSDLRALAADRSQGEGLRVPGACGGVRGVQVPAERRAPGAVQSRRGRDRGDREDGTEGTGGVL